MYESILQRLQILIILKLILYFLFVYYYNNIQIIYIYTMPKIISSVNNYHIIYYEYSEPQENEKINNTKLKKLTGGDVFYARNCKKINK